MEVQIFNEAIDRGCCKRCALRYLSDYRTILTFEHPNTSLVNFGIIPPEQEYEIEPPNKLKKENPCVVCLGVLQDRLINEALSLTKLKDLTEYKHKTFITYITFPACILLRDHSMKIHIKRNFPDYFHERLHVKVNHAWRYSIERQLGKILNKVYDGHAKFTIHFYTEYIFDEEEISVTECFPNFKQQDFSQHNSRNYLNTVLNEMPDDVFCKLVQIPPSIPHERVTLKDMKYFSESIHLLGNYCKYSRNLLQAPFFFKDENVTLDESVAKLITNAFRNVLGSSVNLTFNASSFDCQSVRVLGDGRTFHLQVNDPKFESISQEQFRKIEEIVRKSKIAAVKKLKEADKKDIYTILDAEKMSPRTYKALCLVYKCKNIEYCVNAVNMYSTLHVQQKTPIRALHQYRPYQDKKKKIFYLRAKKVGDSLIELDVCVQSGFYIHEWVCGEFGRSTPSLGEIMKAKVEVLALDLVALNSTIPYAFDEVDVVI